MPRVNSSDKEMPVIFPGREEYDRACRELSIRIDEQGWGNSDTKSKGKTARTLNCRLRTKAVDPADPPERGRYSLPRTPTERVQGLWKPLNRAEMKYRELLQDSHEYHHEGGYLGEYYLLQQSGTGLFRVVSGRG